VPWQGKSKGASSASQAGTPLGGNAASRCAIGLSKVCRIFGAATLTPCSHFVLMVCHRELAMRLEHLRSEIAFMRLQVGRQRKEILLLQRAGISTSSAEALLQRILDKIDALCTERERLKAELPRPKGRVLGGRSW
jgi:hypothetical protein